MPNVRIRRAVEKGLAPVVALAEACVDEDITFVQTAPNHAWFCDRLDCNSREGGKGMVPPADGGDVDDWDVPDDVVAMPGYEILQSAQHLGRVLGILLGNAAELQGYFDTLNAPSDPSRLLQLWDAENRDAFDAHLNEAERLLFNFLAACYSRVEFYRKLVNKGLIVGGLRTDYDRRVAALDSTPLHRWLFGLRRLMQHHALPVSSGRLTIGREIAMRTTFTIDLERLRRRHANEFRGAARAYMEGRDEQDVLEAVADYLALVKELDTWFGDAYVRNHLEEVEAFLGARNTAGQEMWWKRLQPAQDEQLRGPSVPPSEAGI